MPECSLHDACSVTIAGNSLGVDVGLIGTLAQFTFELCDKLSGRAIDA